MAGIYVHIPFCKSRCIYCGFYSTTSLEWQDKYVDALLKELSLRHDYLHSEQVDTVYLGGGTPSQLSHHNLSRLLSALPRASEVTVECNPEDVTPELARLLFSLGVNRVSMGVQTFSAERLQFLRRRHSALQPVKAVEMLREAGITNISIDLMFGFPDETLSEWLADIGKAVSLGVPHISAYSLMYEEDTPLCRSLDEGRIKALDDETCRTMYYALKDRLEEADYEHYEISNFAMSGMHSRHNSSYWQAIPYLGLGAGAHSYDGRSRQWNVSNLKRYIDGINAEKPDFEHEELTLAEMYNDQVTTALRTRKGINIHQGEFTDYLLEQAEPLIRRGLLIRDDDHLHLSREALYTSDDVMSTLIYV